MSDNNLRFEIGHVLFIDIVGYSKLLIEEQKERLHQLTEIVLGTAQDRHLRAVPHDEANGSDSRPDTSQTRPHANRGRLLPNELGHSRRRPKDPDYERLIGRGSLVFAIELSVA
jgi:hypothetical protein